MGFLYPAFRNGKGGPSAHFAPAIAQVPLTQNNEYAEVAYFEVTEI